MKERKVARSFKTELLLSFLVVSAEGVCVAVIAETSFD